MRAQPRLVAWTIFVAVVSIACGNPPAISQPITPTPLAPEITSVGISGPSRMAPGGVAQFTVTAVWANPFNVVDVTTSTTLNSERSILEVNADGSARAHKRGQTDLVATYAGRTLRVRIIVTEEGTFLLRGVITNAATGQPIAATVDVRSADGVTQRAFADADITEGYVLFGVAGPVHVTISAESFATREMDLVVSRDTALDVALTRAGDVH
jgi:hypothetical protein